MRNIRRNIEIEVWGNMDSKFIWGEIDYNFFISRKIVRCEAAKLEEGNIGLEKEHSIYLQLEQMRNTRRNIEI